MQEEPWLVILAQDLGRARTRNEVLAIIDRLEDKYDAFSGPGQELIDALIAEARRRLLRL